MTAAVHPVPLDDAGAAGELRPSALHPSDAARVAAVGLRTRKLRAALSALGIMIGIAAMVGVLGLSESSKSDLLAQLDRLGTNLLTVEAGEGIGRGSGALPTEAVEMIGRIGPVESTSSVTALDLSVYKQDYVDDGQTGGVTVQAVDPDLLDTLGGSVEQPVPGLQVTADATQPAADQVGIRGPVDA